MHPDTESPLFFHVSDPPHENYFFADRNVSCQAVLASPLPQSGSEGPPVHRLLFRFPAGNSGLVVYFSALNEDGNPLELRLKKSSQGRELEPIVLGSEESTQGIIPQIGVTASLEFTTSAVLDMAILGSVRTVRDYAEGHGILNPKVQEAVRIDDHEDGVRISRQWFDQKTTTQLIFTPTEGQAKARCVAEGEGNVRVEFAPGIYSTQVTLNYPQSPYTPPEKLLKPSFHDLITQKPIAVKSLSFLCASEKIYAGGFRFFTYFGRDSMISLLLLMPILSPDEGGPIEVGLKAVLERVDFQSGSVCHEETIGDYPAAQAALTGSGSSDPQYDYKMVSRGFQAHGI